MTAGATGGRTLGELGEFTLIALMAGSLVQGPAVSVGPGDDAAVHLVDGSAVTSVDMFVEGVHFRRDWGPAHAVGRKVIAASVADIEAMGAVPVTAVVAFCAPPETQTSWVLELMAGMSQECGSAGVSLVGGDVTRGRDIVLSVTVTGETKGQHPVLRSGARPGDVVAIRGRLGWAAAGLAVLSRGFRSPRVVVEAYQTPEVPYGGGRQAARAGATSMIDVSDGLLADLGHIARASGVVIDLDTERFDVADPLRAVAAATGADPMRYILTGGEDHALAATFGLGDVPLDWAVVGRVAAVGDQAGPAVLVDGQALEGDAGWEHFGHR